MTFLAPALSIAVVGLLMRLVRYLFKKTPIYKRLKALKEGDIQNG